MNLESLLNSIINDPDYLENLAYGKPRKGHPEGSVGAHVAQLEENIGKLHGVLASLDSGLALSPKLKLELKIVAHVHDSFKAQAAKRVPIADPRSHASLARVFLARFTNDDRLLSLVQNHDVPYSLYQNALRFGDVNEPRLQSLIDQVKDWDLYMWFQVIDNTLPGKLDPAREGPVAWFAGLMEDRLALGSHFRQAHEMMKRALFAG